MFLMHHGDEALLQPPNGARHRLAGAPACALPPRCVLSQQERRPPDPNPGRAWLAGVGPSQSHGAGINSQEACSASWPPLPPLPAGRCSARPSAAACSPYSIAGRNAGPAPARCAAENRPLPPASRERLAAAGRPARAAPDAPLLRSDCRPILLCRMTTGRRMIPPSLTRCPPARS